MGLINGLLAPGNGTYQGASASTVVQSSRVDGDDFDRYQLLADGTVLTGDGTTEPTVNYDGIDEWAVAVGQETMPRGQVSSSGISLVSSGRLTLAYFRAKRAREVSQVSLYTGGTAAGATPTLCRIGLYTVAADSSLALVASTPNDTALFNSTFATHTKALSASYTFVPGQVYAMGVLVVSASTLPQFLGQYMQNFGRVEPRMVGGVDGSFSDLPSDVSAGTSKNGNNGRPLGIFE